MNVKWLSQVAFKGAQEEMRLKNYVVYKTM